MSDARHHSRGWHKASISLPIALIIIVTAFAFAGGTLWNVVSSLNNNAPVAELYMQSNAATPWVKVTTPNTPLFWYVGSSNVITWSSSDLPPHVTANIVLLGTDTGGASWEALIATTGSNGAYTWTVPAALGGHVLNGQYIYKISVRLKDASGAIIAKDDSDVPFYILQPTVKVTKPNTVSSWPVGSQNVITWTSNDLPPHVTANVVLLGTDPGGTSYEALIATTGSNGAYTWTVPQTLQGHDLTNRPNHKISVRMKDASGAIIAKDDSDADFRILLD